LAAMSTVMRRHGGRVSSRFITEALNATEGIPISQRTVVRMMKSKHFKRRTVRAKPLVSSKNAALRLQFAIDRLKHARGGRNIHIAHVDVDEKYFTAHEDARIILPVGDATPTRSLQSKRNRPKVMLLMAFGERYRTYQCQADQ